MVDAGIKDRQRIRHEPGKLNQTKIKLPSYEMYQAEMLDRMLISIQRTEEAFIDVNNRIIKQVNARKDRLNLINSRIQGISQKILALYNQDLIQITSPANFPKISTNDSTQNHPHQSIFFDMADFMTLGQEINEGAQPFQSIRDSNIPELSSLTLKKKLYNTRLQNNPADLQQIISGTLKDITDITKLLLSLNKYRAETMTAINSAIGSVG